MSEIEIQAADGSGGFKAYVARPAHKPTAPAILVIQEIFGVNQGMRDLCDELAASGYIAVCPDLFWRIEPGTDLTDQSEAEWARAFELFGKFDVDRGVEDLKATLAAARALPGCSGKAGAVGYCLGGKLAFLMATRSDSDCSVSYYGVQIAKLLGEAGAITKPLLCHVAEKDSFVPPEEQAQMRAGLSEISGVAVHVYPGAEHGFARIGGKHYDATAAELANSRTADFFALHLG